MEAREIHRPKRPAHIFLLPKISWGAPKTLMGFRRGATPPKALSTNAQRRFFLSFITERTILPKLLS